MRRKSIDFLTPTAHPIVWAGRATAELFNNRCTNEDLPTPVKN